MTPAACGPARRRGPDNVAKYAHASRPRVEAGGTLVVSVADDGVGGAALAAGSGLAGLEDRLAALDGTLVVESPAGGRHDRPREDQLAGAG